MAWQLGTNAKRILPRLNGQLAAICPLLSDAALFLVSQRDNTTRIINLASMKVSLFPGFEKPPAPPPPLPPMGGNCEFLHPSSPKMFPTHLLELSQATPNGQNRDVIIDLSSVSPA